MAIRHQQLQETAAERAHSIAAGSADASLRGDALDAARREDSAWREMRRVRARGTLRNAEFASATLMTGIRRVAWALGALVGGTIVVTVGYGVLGFNGVPDAVMIALAIGICGLLGIGLIACLGYFGSRGVRAGVRRWASWQEIELPSEAPNPEASPANE